MRQGKDFFAALGLSGLSPAMRIYLILVVFFTVLLVLSAIPGPSSLLGQAASEGLKTVLVALLGALSQAGRHS